MPGEMVSFRSNGGTAEGYLARPRSGRGPGVVVIQEWWGLVPNIKDIADRFAAEGFTALAPDLYHGKSTSEPDEAGKLMMAMKMDEAARDMSGAYDFLKSHESSTGKVGSVGFCLGGGLSLYIATLRPIDACVIYYGVLPGVQPEFDRIAGPVLGHYAEHDDWANADAVRSLESTLRGKGKDVDLHIHPGTQHGFFNDTRAEVHNPEESRRSWDETLAFYRKHLA